MDELETLKEMTEMVGLYGQPKTVQEVDRLVAVCIEGLYLTDAVLSKGIKVGACNASVVEEFAQVLHSASKTFTLLAQCRKRIEEIEG